MLEFKKLTDFPRGTVYDILQDAYSYDNRNKRIWENNWKETDDFFYDNPEIAEKYGLVTCIDGEPIGFVTWDPRNRPEYVEIGHNGIREKYKRLGYSHRQLKEAVRRIKEYEGLKVLLYVQTVIFLHLRIMNLSGFCCMTEKQMILKVPIQEIICTMR